MWQVLLYTSCQNLATVTVLTGVHVPCPINNNKVIIIAYAKLLKCVLTMTMALILSLDIWEVIPSQYPFHIVCMDYMSFILILPSHTKHPIVNIVTIWLCSSCFYLNICRDVGVSVQDSTLWHHCKMLLSQVALCNLNEPGSYVTSGTMWHAICHIMPSSAETSTCHFMSLCAERVAYILGTEI